MNTPLLAIFLLITGLLSQTTHVHGRSAEMTAKLNAPVPECMSIGVPIKVEPMPASQAEQLFYRSRSGGATNSRNRVQIPSRGIEIQLDYNVDWTGDNEAGIGASLSPDGRKLIVNSELSSRAYEIRGDGSHSEFRCSCHM